MISSILSLFDTFFEKMKKDHVTAFSAQSAFFILLSVFPFLMLLLTFTKYLPFSQSDVTELMLKVVPTEFTTYTISIVDELYQKATKTVLSMSAIVSLWSASKGILSMMNGLNTIYRTNESRNYFVLRFIATIYTLLFMIILIVMLSVFVFGNKIFDMLIAKIPAINDILGLVISIRTGVGIVIIFLFIALVYKALPNRKVKMKTQIPGAVFTTAAWLLLSYGFSIYIDSFSNFSYMYGSLAGIMLAMLWLYFSMYVIFLGAEINYFITEGYLTRLRNVLK